MLVMFYMYVFEIMLTAVEAELVGYKAFRGKTKGSTWWTAIIKEATKRKRRAYKKMLQRSYKLKIKMLLIVFFDQDSIVHHEYKGSKNEQERLLASLMLSVIPQTSSNVVYTSVAVPP